MKATLATTALFLVGATSEYRRCSIYLSSIVDLSCRTTRHDRLLEETHVLPDSASQPPIYGRGWQTTVALVLGLMASRYSTFMQPMQPSLPTVGRASSSRLRRICMRAFGDTTYMCACSPDMNPTRIDISTRLLYETSTFHFTSHVAS